MRCKVHILHIDYQAANTFITANIVQIQSSYINSAKLKVLIAEN